jgi:two-component system, OmpR family, KDP operon response regulator KdpE
VLSSERPRSDAQPADRTLTTAGIPRPAVVLIEDEPQIRRLLRTSLPPEGYRIFEAGSGQDGLVEVATRQPDLVIVDLGLPDIDGLEVIRRLREWTSVPIIVLSARGREADKVTALDAGADDYVSKPFGVGELLARMRAALRRAATVGQPDEPVFTVGELSIDLVHRRISLGGTDVHLTPIEYKLLTVLVKSAGKVLTHHQMLREVWGPAASAEQNHYLRVYMAQLRRKLEAEPARPRYLLTEPGVGYRLAVD